VNLPRAGVSIPSLKKAIWAIVTSPSSSRRNPHIFENTRIHSRGLAGGVVFGTMTQMMMAPTPDDGQMPVIAMVGRIVGSPTVRAGWAYHLFNSAIIGLIFDWLLGSRVHNYSSAVGCGAVYGFTLWIVGGLILMPLFWECRYSPVLTPPMRMVAISHEEISK
jgi:hypothetical protein